jgi:hypothetical protein
MAKAGKKSTTSKVGQPATQPAARPTDGRHYVPEWKREEVRQGKEAAAREQKEPRERRRAYIEVTDVGNLGEDLPQLLERLWKQFQAGDNQALLNFIIWQLSRGKLPPPEALTEFIARYNRWRLGDVRTLDEAFGVQRHKGKHLRVRRLGGNRSGMRASREQYRRHIVVRVYELHFDEGLPIDKGLFEIVAKELGLARSTAEEIFYEPASRAWRQVAATGCLRVTSHKTEK